MFNQAHKNLINLKGPFYSIKSGKKKEKEKDKSREKIWIDMALISTIKARIIKINISINIKIQNNLSPFLLLPPHHTVKSFRVFINKSSKARANARVTLSAHWLHSSLT